MSSVTDRILKRARGKGRGWVFTPRHFVDFGTRASIDMALSRLAKAGDIRRISRGLYDYPRLHDTLGMLSPDPDSMADALAVQSGDKLAPSGPAAANRLGISTQVPAKTSYAINGKTRVMKVAGRDVTLRHSRAPVLDKASDTANSVLQALAHLGKDKVDANVIHRFAKQIGDDDMRTLSQSRGAMSGWMGDAVLKISQARNG